MACQRRDSWSLVSRSPLMTSLALSQRTYCPTLTPLSLIYNGAAVFEYKYKYKSKYKYRKIICPKDILSYP